MAPISFYSKLKIIHPNRSSPLPPLLLDPPTSPLPQCTPSLFPLQKRAGLQETVAKQDKTRFHKTSKSL